MTKRKTHAEFCEQIKSLVGNEYNVLGSYIGKDKPVLMKHNKCAYEWDVQPNNFLLRGSRCPKCAGLVKKTTKQFKQEVFDLVGDEYKVLGEYIGAHSDIKLIHNISVCGHEFDTTPNKFVTKNNRCPKCFGTPKLTQEEFENRVKELVDNEYLVIGKYIDTDEKVQMKHNTENCNYQYPVRAGNFLYGKARCPKCRNKSKGEIEIRSILDELNINYVSQYKLNGCKNKYLLRFDFAIFKDNKLYCLIEFDGRQHFEPVIFGNQSYQDSIENFELTKENDNIKNAYCNNNNIKLLRISYKNMMNIRSVLFEKIITPLGGGEMMWKG